MDVTAYLSRIDYHGPIEPTAETLRTLHEAHLLAVPFENLDIVLGRPISLDLDVVFQKIVKGRRGGYCYELNGLFSALLRELGFRVDLLSARVAMDQGGFGPEFDHMVLLVRLEERWLGDVGFGDLFLAPLRLDVADEQREGERFFRIADEGTHWTLSERRGLGEWKPAYSFTLQRRKLDDYASTNHYQQTSPESSFTQRRVCSLATPEGRISLSDMRLIITARGERREQTLVSEDEVVAALHEHFAIELDQAMTWPPSEGRPPRIPPEP